MRGSQQCTRVTLRRGRDAGQRGPSLWDCRGGMGGLCLHLIFSYCGENYPSPAIPVWVRSGCCLTSPQTEGHNGNSFLTALEAEGPRPGSGGVLFGVADSRLLVWSSRDGKGAGELSGAPAAKPVSDLALCHPCCESMILSPSVFLTRRPTSTFVTFPESLPRNRYQQSPTLSP